MKPTKLACFFCPWYSEHNLRCILDKYNPEIEIPKECPRFYEVRRWYLIPNNLNIHIFILKRRK